MISEDQSNLTVQSCDIIKKEKKAAIFLSNRHAQLITDRGFNVSDLWTFRDLDFSRVVLSRPMIGPFATRYFSHLFDPSLFATSVIFAVCCQLTVNYSLTMHSVIFTDFDKSVLFQDIQSCF